MLKVKNDNVLGAHPVIVPTTKPHIQLDFPANNKRVFPREGKTETLNPTSKPRAYAEPGEKPSENNGYANCYSSSMIHVSYKENDVPSFANVRYQK